MLQTPQHCQSKACKFHTELPVIFSSLQTGLLFFSNPLDLSSTANWLWLHFMFRKLCITVTSRNSWVSDWCPFGAFWSVFLLFLVCLQEEVLLQLLLLLLKNLQQHLHGRAVELVVGCWRVSSGFRYKGLYIPYNQSCRGECLVHSF